MKLSYAFTGGVLAVAALATLWRTHSPPRAELQIASAPAAAPIAAAQRRAPPGDPGGRVVVYVTGEVGRPGLYRLTSGSRIDDAIRAAGGFTPRGDRLSIDLAEQLSDGEEVLVAPVGVLDPYGATLSRASAGSSRVGSGATTRAGARSRRRSRKRRSTRSRSVLSALAPNDLAPSAPIDVNSASETELEELPGIGPGLAQRIVAFRELNGPFASATDLLDVAGMTDRKLDAIDADIVLGPGTPGRR